MTAPKLTNVEVTDFLTKQQTSDPENAQDWAKLEEYYNKKLWHQLTLKLMDFVQKSSMQVGDRLLQLYNNFLCTFESKINPLSLVEISAHVTQQYQDKRDAITFLEKLEPKVKMNDEASALCKVLQGQIHLEQLNDLDATQKIIELLEKPLDDADGVTSVHARYYKLASEYYRSRYTVVQNYTYNHGTSNNLSPHFNTQKIIELLEKPLDDADGVTSVHARYYKLASEYYRVRGPMGQYYRTALRYIGCVGGGASLPAQERAAIALRLALAAAIAPDVYSLHHLLEHPIMDALKGTSDEWAVELIAAVSIGSLTKFEAVRAKVNIPELHRADRQIKQKIAILCLMEMAFNRSSAQRKLTFSDIAAEARVPHNEVELLVMKALAEKLIRGYIDQVSETVVISWVGPRALGRSQASALAARLQEWALSAQSASNLLHTGASELLTL